MNVHMYVVNNKHWSATLISSFHSKGLLGNLRSWELYGRYLTQTIRLKHPWRLNTHWWQWGPRQDNTFWDIPKTAQELPKERDKDLNESVCSYNSLDPSLTAYPSKIMIHVKKTGGRAGGGTAIDAEILFGNDEDGQDEERTHQRDDTGRMFWRQSKGGQVETIWPFAEENWWIYWWMLKMELQGRRQSRLMDGVREEMQRVGVSEEMQRNQRDGGQWFAVMTPTKAQYKRTYVRLNVFLPDHLHFFFSVFGQLFWWGDVTALFRITSNGQKTTKCLYRRHFSLNNSQSHVQLFNLPMKCLKTESNRLHWSLVIPKHWFARKSVRILNPVWRHFR